MSPQWSMVKFCVLALLTLNSLRRATCQSDGYLSDYSDKLNDQATDKSAISEESQQNPRTEPTQYGSMSLHTVNPNVFKLSDEQCGRIDDVFKQSGRSSALYMDSCQASFIQISLLNDGAILVFTSMPDWAFGKNRSLVHISKVKQRILFNFASAHLVVRVEGCRELSQASVSVSPPPKQSLNGIVQVAMSDQTVGEQLIHDKLSEMVEIQISEYFTSRQCFMTNSYIALCALNRFASCEIRIVNEEHKLLECNCGRSSTNYFSPIFCFVVLLLLIGISLVNFAVPEECYGVDEENASVAVSSKSLAYHYQVIFRVGCPSYKFDCQNSIIDFELLDSKMKKIVDEVRFSLTDQTGAKPKDFVYNLFVLSPLPTLAGVRVSHSRSNSDSGIFLFDILVNFIGGPEDLDDIDETDRYTLKPNAVDVSSIKNKRLKIFAYILDCPKVYTKLGKRANIQLPPFCYPQVSHSFMKILLWLACTQTLFFAIKLLDYVPAKWPMILLSIGIALLISLVLLIELALAIWIHLELSQKTMVYELIYGVLASKKKEMSSKPWKWSYYANTVFVLMLLLSVGLFTAMVGSNIKQPLAKSFYTESIFVIVLVAVGAICFITHQAVQSHPILNRGRLSKENELMCESMRRAQLHSASFSDERTADNTLNDQSPTSLSSNQSSKSKLAQTTFEMF